MEDYDRGWIKWFVVAFMLGFGIGLLLKALIMSTEAYGEGNVGMEALAGFIVPACCIVSQMITLGVYTRHKASAQSEGEADSLSHETVQDDMVLNDNYHVNISKSNYANDLIKPRSAAVEDEDSAVDGDDTASEEEQDIESME